MRRAGHHAMEWGTTPVTLVPVSRWQGGHQWHLSGALAAHCGHICQTLVPSGSFWGLRVGTRTGDRSAPGNRSVLSESVLLRGRMSPQARHKERVTGDCVRKRVSLALRNSAERIDPSQGQLVMELGSKAGGFQWQGRGTQGAPAPSFNAPKRTQCLP